MKKTIKKLLAVGMLTQMSMAAFAQDQAAMDSLYSMSLEELMNVEITVASKKAEKIGDAAGVISVLTKEELERFGGITLRDILERMPSIIGVSPSFTERYGLATRGDQIKNTSGHNLILINGRPTREIVEGGISSEMLAAFPVNIIERIEVIRGPGSVLYGSNAFSTVINIVTKEGGNNVGAALLGGTDGAYGANAQATFGNDDVHATVGLRYMDKGTKKIDYSSTDIMSGDVTRQRIELEDKAKAAYVGVQYKGLSFTTSYNDYAASYFQGNSVGGDPNQYAKWFNNLGYRVKAAEKWNMDFNATYNRSTLEIDNSMSGIGRKSNDLVFEWTNHIDLGKNSGIVAGGLYNNISGYEYDTNTKEKNSNGTLGIGALYAQIDYWAVENLKLIGGVQANKLYAGDNSSDVDLNPRLGAIWYPVSRLNVKALYSTAFRAPSINELYLKVPDLGDSTLLSEKVKAFDIGVNYQGERFQVGVNYFNTRQLNIINIGTGDGGLLVGYVNNGEFKFQGVEFEGKYYATKELFFTGSMLYQKNKNEAGEENTTPVAAFGTKLGVSYSKNGFNVSLFDIYQGDLGDSYKVESNPNPSAGAYNILNFYGSAKLVNWSKSGSLSVFVQANNILGEDVWQPDSITNSTGTISTIVGSSIYGGVKFMLN